MKSRAARFAGGVASVTLFVVFVTACSTSASKSSEAKKAALSACKTYLLAGLGVPNVTPAERKSHVASAVNGSSKAAQLDPKWMELRNAFVTLNENLLKVGYASTFNPQTDYVATITSDCENAGLGV